MRELVNMALGTQIHVDGRAHRYEGVIRVNVGPRDAPDAVRLVDELTNESHAWLDQEFRRLYCDGRIVLKRPYENACDAAPEPIDDNSSDAEVAQDQKRRVRQAYLTAYDADPVALSDKALNNFVARVSPAVLYDHIPPSPGTLRRMIRSRGDAGDRRLRFMGDRRRRGPREMKFAPIVQAIINEAANRYYSEIRFRPIDVYVEVRDAIVTLNRDRVADHLPRIVPPSRTTKQP